MKASKFITGLSTSLLLLVSTVSFSQLGVTTGLTPTQYVQNLLGAGVTFSNVTYTGSNGQSTGTARRGTNAGTASSMSFDVPIFQIGNFSGGGSTNLNLASGIVLSNGDVRDAGGPSIYSPDAQFPNAYTGVNATDADLENISGGGWSYDASVLEFDFVPQGNTIEFKYVFASSEYPNWVGDSYNDAFGFFLSGPGITGTANLATVPSTSNPIAVNTINNGVTACSLGGPSGPCTNCAYYVENCDGTTIAYHGFTTVMTATYNVTCGQTYHIKLAICDIEDALWDSAVFLENNSFTSNASTNTTQTLSVPSCESTTSILDPSPIDGEPSFTYLWNTGATSPTITVPNGTGPYLVAVTDACGAIDTVNFVIDCPLSVNLKVFEAQKDGKTALLTWQTASERNNDHFIIERAGQDGVFKEIIRTPAYGDGNSNVLQTYKTHDNSPLLGMNYYRLISVDQEGLRATSEIRSLNFKGDGKIEIVPNPNKGTFKMVYYFEEKGKSVVEVYAASGELAIYKEIVVEQVGYQQINFINKDLAQGFYYIKLYTNNKVVLEKMQVE